MLKTHIELKHFMISVIIYTISSLCVQVQAIENPDKQVFSNQQEFIQKQSKASANSNPQAANQTKIAGTDTNWPLILLTPAVIGLVILLGPSLFDRKKTTTETEGQDNIPVTVDVEHKPDAEDDYLAMIEAEAKLEEQLDAEEELDSIDRKTQGRIGARDRKHNNRVATKRKR